MKFGIGQSVRRTEDVRLVTGRGEYTDDLHFEREVYAAFARSPHAHARLSRVDVSAARAAPGIVAVLTYGDVAWAGPMPCEVRITDRDGAPPKASPKPLLAKDRVTFVGEAIAMVIAETYAQAKDAAELVAVDYEPLEAAGTLSAAPEGAQIWETAPGNLVFDWAIGDEARCNAAFVSAAHGVSLEQPLVLIAAKSLGRPVRWSAERNESFLADAHARDVRTKGELALDAEGRVLAMRINGTANMGGYLSIFGPFIPTSAGGRIFGGLYRIPVLFANVKGYFSNTAPVDAYRGAGRPEAAYLIERLMDVAALKIGLDRVEIRKRNLPRPEELPYTNWSGLNFDSGNYPFMLTECFKRAGGDGFAARRRQSEARGLRRGLGVAYYVEITAAVGHERVAVKFTGNGGVELFVSTQSTGQGHETAYAQIVAEHLGVPFETITVRQGDSRWTTGMGTGGSRSLNMAGSALQSTSDEVIRKGRAAAGQVLQSQGRDVAFEVVDGAGRFHVAGGEQSISVAELAVTLKRERIPGFEEGLDTDGSYTGAAPTFPNGCHVCEVEVDPETGKVDLVAYHVLDDFGRVINPMLVAGQVHGGIAQGVGQALLENCVYDEDTGQLLTASFTDYAMPRADDLPDIAFAYEEFPCKTHALGAKGCGEAGTVGALPAVMSAVADAIGVPHIDMPATPERVWRAMREAATNPA